MNNINWKKFEAVNSNSLTDAFEALSRVIFAAENNFDLSELVSATNLTGVEVYPIERKNGLGKISFQAKYNNNIDNFYKGAQKSIEKAIFEKSSGRYDGLTEIELYTIHSPQENDTKKIKVDDIAKVARITLIWRKGEDILSILHKPGYEHLTKLYFGATNDDIIESLEVIKNNLNGKNESGDLIEKIIEESKELILVAQPNLAFEKLSFIEFRTKDDIIKQKIYILKIQSLIQSEKYNEATKLTAAFINLYPTNNRFLILLIEVMILTGDYKNARLQMEDKNILEVSKIDKLNLDMQLLISSSVNIEREEIIGLLNIKLSPFEMLSDEGVEARYYYLRSILHFENKEYEQSLNNIEIALKIFPDNVSYRSQKIIYDAQYNADKKMLNQELIEKYTREIDILEQRARNDENSRRKIELDLKRLFILNLHYGISVGNISIYEVILNRIVSNIDGLKYIHITELTLKELTVRYIYPFDYLSSKTLIHYMMKISSHIDGGLVEEIVIKSLYAFSSNNNLEELIEFANKVKSKTSDLLIAVQKKKVEDLVTLLRKCSVKKIEKIVSQISDTEFIMEVLASLSEDKNNFLELRIAIFFDQKNFEGIKTIIGLVNLKNITIHQLWVINEAANKSGAYSTEKDSLLEIMLRGEFIQNQLIYARLVYLFFKLKEYGNVKKYFDKIVEIKGILDSSNLNSIISIYLDVCIKEYDCDLFNAILEKLITTDNDDFGIMLQLAITDLSFTSTAEGFKYIIRGFEGLSFIRREHYLSIYKYLQDLNGVDGNFFNNLITKVNEGCYIKIENLNDTWFVVDENSRFGARSLGEENVNYIGKTIGEVVNRKADENLLTKSRKIISIVDERQYLMIQANYAFQKEANEGDGNIIKQFEFTDLNSFHENLLARFNDDDKIWELFKQEEVPLAFIVSELGIFEAFKRIRNSYDGLLRINNGTEEDISSKKNIAEKALSGIPTYLDVTSLYILIHTDILQKIIANIPNLKVSTSALNMVNRLIEKFALSPMKDTMYINITEEHFNIEETSHAEIISIREKLLQNYQFINQHAAEVFSLSDEKRINHEINLKIDHGITDSLLSSQQEDTAILLSEDNAYPIIHSKITGNRLVESFSLFSIITVLYKKNKLTWREYLKIFNILVIYKQSFLTTNAEDIIKTIYGDNSIVVLRPEDLRYLNLGIVWSPKYGTNTSSVVNIVNIVLARLLLDSSISDKLFISISRHIYIPFLKPFDFADRYYWVNALLKELDKHIYLNKFYVNDNAKLRINILINDLSEYITGKIIDFGDSMDLVFD